MACIRHFAPAPSSAASGIAFGGHHGKRGRICEGFLVELGAAYMYFIVRTAAAGVVDVAVRENSVREVHDEFPAVG